MVSAGATGKVNATSLNLREAPDLSAPSDGLLVLGDPVTVLFANDDASWLNVSALVDGHTRMGWTQADFVSLDTPPPIDKPADIPDNVAALPDGSPVPFADLDADDSTIFWPVVTADPQALLVSYLTTAEKDLGNSSRRFLANRNRGARHHVGIDLFCAEGDDVVAIADGKIVGFAHFLNSGGEQTFQLLVNHGSVAVNYGEVVDNSNQLFHWRIGDAVQAGQRIGRIGATKMLHFETYEPGVTHNQVWMVGGQRPSGLLNPTQLLLRIASKGQRKNVGIA
jgi:murein DD-endopeptidase MepM/ murein hydrolase activator NlpD